MFLLSYFPMQLNVALGCVLLVLVVSLLSKQFAGEGSVKYTEWFTQKLNLLLDTAVVKADEGDQNQDPIRAIQSYTTALTIMDTLDYLLANSQDLSTLGQMNVKAFVEHVEDRRLRAVKMAATSGRTTA